MKIEREFCCDTPSPRLHAQTREASKVMCVLNLFHVILFPVSAQVTVKKEKRLRYDLECEFLPAETILTVQKAQLVLRRNPK